MPNIVAGSFEDQILADRAADALRAAGFTPDAIMTFALEAHVRRGARPPLGPNGIAPVSAGGTKPRASGRGRNAEADNADNLPPPPERTAGVMLAVHAPEPAAQERALRMLVSEGARDLETAEGTWAEGRWIDFDWIGRQAPANQAHPQRGRSRR